MINIIGKTDCKSKLQHLQSVLRGYTLCGVDEGDDKVAMIWKRSNNDVKFIFTDNPTNMKKFVRGLYSNKKGVVYKWKICNNLSNDHDFRHALFLQKTKHKADISDVYNILKFSEF